MKKTCLIITIIACLGFALASQEQTNAAPTFNTNSLSSNFSMFKGATNIAVIPFTKYDVTSHQFGYGISALYKVTDNFWSGLRLDHMNGYNSTAGVQAQLKTDMQIAGFTFSPFLETSVGIGSSALYGSAGPGAFIHVWSHQWDRAGRPPVVFNVSAVADFEHVVQSGSEVKNSNQLNAGPILNLSF